MTELIEIEKRLPAFKDEIRKHRDHYGKANDTLNAVEINKLTTDEMQIWEEFKMILKTVDQDTADDTGRLAELLAATRDLNVKIHKLFSSGKGSEFLAWMNSRTSTIFALKHVPDSLQYVLEDKAQFCSG